MSPARRAPSAAQVAASERAWDAALGVVEGRFQKGAVVVDHTGQTWRLTRAGRRYHEDVGSLVYPAVPCRPLNTTTPGINWNGCPKSYLFRQGYRNLTDETRIRFHENMAEELVNEKRIVIQRLDNLIDYNQELAAQ